MTPTQPDPHDEFVRAFWRDVDDGRVAPIDDYRRRFPGLGPQIDAEFAAWRAADARSAPPSADRGARAAPGSIGRYRIDGPLARGGMGLLLLGHDPELQRRVVLKTTRARAGGLDGPQRDRLLREARLASRLDHDAICPVLDVVVQDDEVFALMPLIDGESLAEWIERATRMRRGSAAQPAPSHAMASWGRDASRAPRSGAARRSTATAVPGLAHPARSRGGLPACDGARSASSLLERG